MPGPEILIVVAIIAVLFGGSKIPQFARSLGSAKSEFEKGASGSNTTSVAAPEPARVVAADTVIVTDDVVRQS